MKDDNEKAKLFGIILSSTVVTIVITWALWNIMKSFMDAIVGLLFLIYTTALQKEFMLGTEVPSIFFVQTTQ